MDLDIGAPHIADLVRKLRSPVCEDGRVIYEIELRGPASANDLEFFLALHAVTQIEGTFEEAAHVIAVFAKVKVETVAELDMWDFADLSADCATLMERLADLMNAPAAVRN